MKSVLLALLLLAVIICPGQDVILEQQPAAPVESSLYFDQEKFDGRFAVLVLSEDDYDYYVTDLSRLKGRFEMIYFLNLSYQDHRLVNIDPDIEKSQMWFKAHYQFPEKDIICLLDDFLKESLETSSAWSESEKQAWMNKFDKYNTKKDNDQ